MWLSARSPRVSSTSAPVQSSALRRPSQYGRMAGAFVAYAGPHSDADSGANAVSLSLRHVLVRLAKETLTQRAPQVAHPRKNEHPAAAKLESAPTAEIAIERVERVGSQKQESYPDYALHHRVYPIGKKLLGENRGQAEDQDDRAVAECVHRAEKASRSLALKHDAESSLTMFARKPIVAVVMRMVEGHILVRVGICRRRCHRY